MFALGCDICCGSMPTTRRRRPQPTLANPTLRSLLGAAFLHRLEDTDDAHAPLRIGSQRWTVHQLAVELGVVHTKAARMVTRAADSIGAKNVRDLYQRSSPYTFAGIKQLGETALYVLWRVFEADGLDPDAWATAGEREDALVSFRALKLREQAADARTQHAARAGRRRAARESHEARVHAVLKG